MGYTIDVAMNVIMWSRDENGCLACTIDEVHRLLATPLVHSAARHHGPNRKANENHANSFSILPLTLVTHSVSAREWLHNRISA